MSDTLPDFPVDDITLDCILHALNGSWDVDHLGEHYLTGATYTFSQLLDFLSGYEPSKAVPIDWDEAGNTTIVEYDGAIYHYTDVIKALILEIKRLRGD